MKKFLIFLVTLAVMLAPLSCFAEAPAQEASSGGFMFEPQHFVGNLQYMLSGMLGIFVVIGLIVIVTVVLNRVTSKKQND